MCTSVGTRDGRSFWTHRKEGIPEAGKPPATAQYVVGSSVRVVSLYLGEGSTKETTQRVSGFVDAGGEGGWVAGDRFLLPAPR